MCGIVGVVNMNGNAVLPFEIKNMTDAIAHRGPDGEGQWTEGNVGLGHRRLSVIDLSNAAHQPMLSNNERFILSYNGEVYNFQELRSELESRGHQFKSRSDTEVVLNAFIEWGVGCLDKFNGMFAFAIWDRAERTLTLARDRYGIKPLYYTYQNGSIIFGSEIKAIQAHSEFKAELDKEAMLEYFTFQNFFTDRTLHKDVKILPGGSYYQFSSNSHITSLSQIEPTQYWDYHFREPKQPIDENEYLEELDRLLVQAVNRQLVADVDIGSYLSGGMDSGTITALAAKKLPFMHTFTVGFDLSSASGLELGYDEREKAEQMSYLFKTEHYEMVLKAGDMERCISDLVWHLEEPRVGQSYPNYYASKLASRFGKVVLSGTGGDELFGGYPWRYYRGVNSDDFEHYIDQYYAFWNRLVPNNTLHKVFSPIWNDVKNVWTRDIMRDVFKVHSQFLTTPEDYVNHSLYFEAKTFLHGLLVVEDKLSMAHSIETRVPFLDNDLVDFAMGVSVHNKLSSLKDVIRLNENDLASKQQYFQKSKDGKALLRKTMSKYIPESVTKREKQGFSAPDASWFKGDSLTFVQDVLFSSNARIYDYLDKKAVQTLVTDHLRGKVNRRLLIWSLLNMEMWCKNFL
jgi:asparagine synthase (glutamine-hydrolysing)